ncbi:hypothetical protein SAMN04244553_3581 [Nocardia amikacinitolerans]|uniref:Minor tail protein n=1 Tax=Nocardia amikacinitolerans TaxID=756689 RepID=A0A285LG64_9NOCA|nr:hypothetical protein [Nocardia amikacinitolerans]SNY83948.1 hypothetical protein SAMN04244553_3581 [Nocardia amikacinitolerans]
MSTVGEYFAATRIRGINEGIGTPGVVQAMQGTPADGSLELPVGVAGPAGEQGPAAAPFRWEGDIADPTALAALATRLGPAQAGKAWRVLSTNALMIWNGSSFDASTDAFGAHGPIGEANTLSIGTVTTGAVGGDVEVTVTGAPPAQTVNITVPRGVKGLKGDPGGPGPITGASDYDNTSAPVDGAVPMWSAATSKWTPTPSPGWRGPWTISEATAWDGGVGFAADASNTNTSPLTVAIVNVPAQDVAWRPMVLGGAQVRSGGSGTRVDLEACIGSAAGQVVSVGSGLSEVVWWFNQLLPTFATSAVTPASSTGVIAAGAPAAIHLVMRRNAGSDTFSYSRLRAHVAVWAVPVTGAP